MITIYGVSDLKKTQCEANCLLQIDDVVDKRVGTTMETCRGQVTWNQCFEASFPLVSLSACAMFAQIKVVV